MTSAEAIVAELRATGASNLEVYVNGKRHVIYNPSPEATLLEFLRGIGLTGTKLGCGEVNFCRKDITKLLIYFKSRVDAGLAQ